MSKGSMESRVERLESRVNGEGLEGDLYDYDGNLVEARIMKLPTRERRGLAIMADGARREIAPTANMLDILLEGRKQQEAGMVTDEAVILYHTCYGYGGARAEHAPVKTDYREMLFLRIAGQIGMIEKLCNDFRQERSEV